MPSQISNSSGFPPGNRHHWRTSSSFMIIISYCSVIYDFVCFIVFCYSTTSLWLSNFVLIFSVWALWNVRVWLFDWLFMNNGRSGVVVMKRKASTNKSNRKMMELKTRTSKSFPRFKWISSPHFLICLCFEHRRDRKDLET
jgi:hypothetical protein